MYWSQTPLFWSVEEEEEEEEEKEGVWGKALARTPTQWSLRWGGRAVGVGRRTIGLVSSSHLLTFRGQRSQEGARKWWLGGGIGREGGGSVKKKRGDNR